MKKLFMLAGVIAAATAAGVYAQTRTAEDGEALQRELERKAVRIPKQELAAALRSAEDRRTARARFVERAPDLAALREELSRTEEEDAQTQAARDTQTSETARLAPPPRPGIRALSAERLANADAEEVDRVLIPVLLPAQPGLRDRLKVYGMRNVYTASAEIDANASLAISGTCNRVIGGDPDVVEFRKKLAEEPPRLSGTGAEYHISRNDFGVDLSFSKFGCGYVMTVECGNPADDARCSGDEFITDLANSMILANPALAGGE